MAINPEDLAAIGKNADAATESLLGVGKAIKSVEEAYANFNKAAGDTSIQDATKNFYSLIESMSAYRKSANDVTAASDETNEKINLFRVAISNAENELRNSYAERTKFIQQLEILRQATEELEAAEKSLQQQREKLGIKNLEDYEQKLTQINAKIAAAANEEEKTALESERLQLESLKNQEIEIKNKKQIVKTDIESTTEQQKQYEIQLKKLAAYLPLQRFEESRLRAINQTRDSMGDILNKLVASGDKSNVFASAILSMQQNAEGASNGISGLFKTFGEGLTEALFTPEKALNRVFNLINDKLIKSTLEFDQALAKVGQSTGGFRKEFEGIAINMGGVSFVALSEYGVTLEKYGQSYQALSKNLAGFNNLSQEQRKLLTENASAMNSLGVSSENYANLLVKFMGAVGKTAEGSRDMINALAKDAIALGRSVSQYTSEFESAMSRISGYGREAIGIFKELNALSVATRGVITSQDLLSISDRFKDFESAADAVSKLNVILGGTSVSIIDMMKADPAQQIMMIKRAASEAGLEFDKLNIGYKRLLAEYFGGDINKAQAFFNANIAEAQQLMSKAVESEKELEERKKANIAFQEKLNSLIDNMRAALMPMLTHLNTIVSAFTKFMSFPGAPLIVTIGLISSALGVAGLAITRVKMGFDSVRSAIQDLKAANADKSNQIINSANRETAEIQEETTAIKQQTEAMRQQRQVASQPKTGGSQVAPGATPPPAAGGGMLKTFGIGAAITAGTMAVGFGLSQWSASLEAQRQKELEEKRSLLRREEMAAQKEMFGTLVEPVLPPQEDVMVIVRDDGSVEYVTNLKGSGGKPDQLQGTANIAGGKMVAVGTEQGEAKKIISANNSFSQTMQESETTINKAGDKTTNVAGGTTNINKITPPSSMQESKQQTSIIVNATLKLQDKEMTLIAENVSSEIKSIA